MPRMKARALEFGLNETLTETRLVDVRTSVETNTTGVTDVLGVSNVELSRIRRLNEIGTGVEIGPNDV